ncbi:MAG: twin-arginine translocase TatA/TatE family subunit [bacterium]
MGFGNIGFTEILLLFLVALLLFGAKRLPEIGKSLGSGIREFKKATKEVQREVSIDVDEDAKKSGPGTSVPKPPPIE